MTTTSTKTATAARVTTGRISPAHESATTPLASPRTASPLGPVSVSAVSVSPQISWLSASGRLVGEDAVAHLATVLDGQRAIGCRFVWLDLSQVPIIDRSSFDVLAEAHQAFRAAGGTLVLTGVSPRIARLLELTKSDQSLVAIVPEADPHPDPADHRAQESQGQRDGLADQGTAAGATVAAQRVIDRAVGVVMGRTRCGVGEATEQLFILTRATGRSARQVAQSILDDAATLPYRATPANKTKI